MTTTLPINDYPPSQNGARWGNTTSGPYVVPSPAPTAREPFFVTTISGSSDPCSLWNGGYCTVCGERILGFCGRDHTKFLNGYIGRHR